MRQLRRLLPSLNCLYAIDAVARHMSFTLAAQELGLSQPAVSKSVRVAESNLGFDLFERRPEGLALTARGRDLCEEINVSLTRLHRVASEDGTAVEKAVLKLIFSSSFVSMWLLPRLQDFRRRHPHITFTISESNGRPTPAETDFDFSSRLDDGGGADWSDVQAWEYAPEVLYAVAAPDYVADHPDAMDLATLHRATLLHAVEAQRTRMDWSGWFEAAGHGYRTLPEGMVFSGYHAAIQAALLGQGVALGWEHLVGTYERKNQLRRVADTRVVTGRKFHLVTPADRPVGPAHAIFRDWVIAEMQQERSRSA